MNTKFLLMALIICSTVLGKEKPPAPEAGDLQASYISNNWKKNDKALKKKYYKKRVLLHGSAIKITKTSGEYWLVTLDKAVKIVTKLDAETVKKLKANTGYTRKDKSSKQKKRTAKRAHKSIAIRCSAVWTAYDMNSQTFSKVEGFFFK